MSSTTYYTVLEKRCTVKGMITRDYITNRTNPLGSLLGMGASCLVAFTIFFHPVFAAPTTLQPFMDEATRLSDSYFNRDLDAQGYQQGMRTLLERYDDLPEAEYEKLEERAASLFAIRYKRFELYLAERATYGAEPKPKDTKILQEMFGVDAKEVFASLSLLKPAIDYLNTKGFYLYSDGWHLAPWARLWPKDLKDNPELQAALLLIFPQLYIDMFKDASARGPIQLSKAYLPLNTDYMVMPKRIRTQNSTRVYTKEAWQGKIEATTAKIITELQRQNKTAVKQGRGFSHFNSDYVQLLKRIERKTDWQLIEQMVTLQELGLDPKQHAIKVKGQEVSVIKAWKELKAEQKHLESEGEEKKWQYLFWSSVATAVTTGMIGVVVVTAPVSIPAVAAGGALAGKIFFKGTVLFLSVGSAAAVGQAVNDASAEHTQVSFGEALFEHLIENSTGTFRMMPVLAGISLAPMAVGGGTTLVAGAQAGEAGVMVTQDIIKGLSYLFVGHSAGGAIHSWHDARGSWQRARDATNPYEQDYWRHQGGAQAIDSLTHAVYAFALGRALYKSPPRIGVEQPQALMLTPRQVTPGVFVGSARPLLLETPAGGTPARGGSSARPTQMSDAQLWAALETPSRPPSSSNPVVPRTSSWGEAGNYQNVVRNLPGSSGTRPSAPSPANNSSVATTQRTTTTAQPNTSGRTRSPQNNLQTTTENAPTTTTVPEMPNLVPSLVVPTLVPGVLPETVDDEVLDEEADQEPAITVPQHPDGDVMAPIVIVEPDADAPFETNLPLRFLPDEQEVREAINEEVWEAYRLYRQENPDLSDTDFLNDPMRFILEIPQIQASAAEESVEDNDAVHEEEDQPEEVDAADESERGLPSWVEPAKLVRWIELYRYLCATVQGFGEYMSMEEWIAHGDYVSGDAESGGERNPLLNVNIDDVAKSLETYRHLCNTTPGFKELVMVQVWLVATVSGMLDFSYSGYSIRDRFTGESDYRSTLINALFHAYEEIRSQVENVEDTLTLREWMRLPETINITAKRIVAEYLASVHSGKKEENRSIRFGENIIDILKRIAEVLGVKHLQLITALIQLADAGVRGEVGVNLLEHPLFWSPLERRRFSRRGERVTTLTLDKTTVEALNRLQERFADETFPELIHRIIITFLNRFDRKVRREETGGNHSLFIDEGTFADGLNDGSASPGNLLIPFGTTANPTGPGLMNLTPPTNPPGSPQNLQNYFKTTPGNAPIVPGAASSDEPAESDPSPYKPADDSTFVNLPPDVQDACGGDPRRWVELGRPQDYESLIENALASDNLTGPDVPFLPRQWRGNKDWQKELQEWGYSLWTGWFKYLRGVSDDRIDPDSLEFWAWWSSADNSFHNELLDLGPSNAREALELAVRFIYFCRDSLPQEYLRELYDKLCLSYPDSFNQDLYQDFESFAEYVRRGPAPSGP